MSKQVESLHLTRHIGVSALRDFNVSKLHEFRGVAVIHDRAMPVAALIDYKTYLRFQELCLQVNRMGGER